MSAILNKPVMERPMLDSVLDPEVVRAISEMIEATSEKAYENDQQITIQMRYGDAVVDMTVGPEDKFAQANVPWQVVLMNKLPIILFGVVIIFAIVFSNSR